MTCVICIANSEVVALALHDYLIRTFGVDVECYFMTYDRSTLSGKLFAAADLFVLELLRRDDAGYRAEGIFAAERLLAAGKNAVVVSGAAAAHRYVDLYWDLSSPESLGDHIRGMLRSAQADPTQLDEVKTIFGQYCRPAVDAHRDPRR